MNEKLKKLMQYIAEYIDKENITINDALAFSMILYISILIQLEKEKKQNLYSAFEKELYELYKKMKVQ